MTFWYFNMSICRSRIDTKTLMFILLPIILSKRNWVNTKQTKYKYVILDYQYMPANLYTTRVRPVNETAGVLSTHSTSIWRTICSISRSFHLIDPHLLKNLTHGQFPTCKIWLSFYQFLAFKLLSGKSFSSNDNREREIPVSRTKQ